MADSEGNNLRKFCLQYYNSKTCIYGPNCQYNHKLRYEVEPVAFLAGTDYFLGQLPLMTNQRPCYFYKLGKCMYQDKCRFLHDNESSLRNNHEESTVEEVSGDSPIIECSVNLPSTSSQPNQAEYLNFTTETTSDGENSPASVNKELWGEEASEIEVEDEEGAGASPPLVIVNNRNWADAPEFVPQSNKPKSYAQVLSPKNMPDKTDNRKLCPYTTKDGICVNLATCTNVHGDFCDMCERFILHPYNEEERKKHQQECIMQHEKNMELSFAIQRSKEKSCGVCFEVIMEKANGEQRFGILPNCNHCFCLTCIRKWRQARQFENKIIRADAIPKYFALQQSPSHLAFLTPKKNYMGERRLNFNIEDLPTTSKRRRLESNETEVLTPSRCSTSTSSPQQQWFYNKEYTLCSKSPGPASDQKIFQMKVVDLC